MGFPKEVKERALIACKRHCVLCERNKGLGIECHHIVPQAQGGEDTFENCIPVCFDCHMEVGSYNSEHPKGNKFSPNELKIRRDSFYKRVEMGEFPKNEVVSTIYETDRKLYQKIKDIFKSPNLKMYLQEYDLGNDFDNTIFWPLIDIDIMSKDPENEFMDQELEYYKQDLFEKVQKFLAYKAVNTFPTPFGTQAIKTWKNDKISYEDKKKINAEFNELATAVWEAYAIFVRKCMQKQL